MQGVDRVQVGVYVRQHDTLVVAVGDSGGGVVPVQRLAAARGVVVGGGVHVWETAISGAIVQVMPAAYKVSARGAAAVGFVFESLHVWQTVEWQAQRAGLACDKRAVARGALSSHRVAVRSVLR